MDSIKSHSGVEICRNGGGDSCSFDPAVAAFVCDFLQDQLGKNGYQWRSTLVQNGGTSTTNRTIEAKVGLALRGLADEFISQYKDHFVQMCGRLNVTAENMRPTIEGVANELFSEGIKWARIVAFFVFGSELALHCKNSNISELINVVAYSVSSYVSEKLLPWINDHGGWEGLIKFHEGEDEEPSPNSRWPSVKNLLCLGISAIGALTLGAVLTKS